MQRTQLLNEGMGLKSDGPFIGSWEGSPKEYMVEMEGIGKECNTRLKDGAKGREYPKKYSANL